LRAGRIGDEDRFLVSGDRVTSPEDALELESP
jgi:hypothetical protein